MCDIPDQPYELVFNQAPKPPPCEKCDSIMYPVRNHFDYQSVVHEYYCEHCGWECEV